MDNDLILLGHGSGGNLSHQLLEELLIPTLSGLEMADRNDAALLELDGGGWPSPPTPMWLTPSFSPAAASATWR